MGNNKEEGVKSFNCLGDMTVQSLFFKQIDLEIWVQEEKNPAYGRHKNLSTDADSRTASFLEKLRFFVYFFLG